MTRKIVFEHGDDGDFVAHGPTANKKLRRSDAGMLEFKDGSVQTSLLNRFGLGY